jgi:flagellar basal body rod protein FlgG
MMQIPRSGIAAASRDLNVVSNNLANALTTGFKKSHSLRRCCIGRLGHRSGCRNAEWNDDE